MKISIITVSYNSANTIEDCIKSVNKQTYHNIEHIFIDGLSSDSTISIIHALSNRDRIIVSEADNGIYDAMNKGISIANGDVVGILNSDDYLKSNSTIETIMNAFQKHKCDAIFGNLDFVDCKNPSKVVRKWKSSPFQKGSFAKGWHPPHPTFYVKKNIYDQYGDFDISLNVSADFELMLRFIEKFEINTHFIDETIVQMRYGGESTGSLRKIIEGNINIMKAFKKNDLKVSKFYPIRRFSNKLFQFIKR